MTVAGLVLAAGAGRRYGGPKALALLADGTPFLTRAVRALREGGCDPVLAVLGAGAEEAAGYADGAQLVLNPAWATGMGSSLVVGLEAMAEDVVAALVLLVDTPGIGAAAIARVAALGSTDVVAVGTYAGTRGHPVLIGRAHWPTVRARAAGDAGARDFLRTHPSVVAVPCEDVATAEDVDMPEDLPR